MTPTPKTRFSMWTLLRTPGRFTTRPLPVHFTTKMSVVRPFSVLSKDELALRKTGRFLSKAEILGVGVFSPLPIWFLENGSGGSGSACGSRNSSDTGSTQSLRSSRHFVVQCFWICANEQYLSLQSNLKYGWFMRKFSKQHLNPTVRMIRTGGFRHGSHTFM